MITKEMFIEYMEFIERKDAQEKEFIKALEKLSPSTYCDAFIYDEYEDKLISLLRFILNDREELILYRLYEYKSMDDASKAEQVKETPEVESWETVYDYLIKEKENENTK